ncbi:MAG: hypothetical protein ABH881_01000 [bacterium]
MMTWEEIAKRDDIVGGDVETHDGDVVHHGPIESIKVNKDQVVFKSPWVARYDQKNKKWKNHHVTSFEIATSCKPRDIGGGKIFFEIPHIGFGIIFPKNGLKLDPARVEGLKL